MMTPASPQAQVTQLLCEWRSGDGGALERLIPFIQPELQRLAHHYMGRERAGHTLQTTALVNDAYLRLADHSHPQWQNRAHFFAAAAQLMRYFGGLTMEEIAEVLKIHVNTVRRDWATARAWLFAALSGENLDAI